MSKQGKIYVWSGKDAPWSTHTRTRKTMIYDAVKRAGEKGCTCDDISAAVGIPKAHIWFLLSELRREGLLKRPGDAIDPTMLDPQEAKLYAMTALENALALNATEHVRTCPTCRLAGNDENRRCQIYKDLNRQFIRYNKIKGAALHSGNMKGSANTAEMSVALRQAMVDLVKMVF